MGQVGNHKFLFQCDFGKGTNLSPLLGQFDYSFDLLVYSGWRTSYQDGHDWMEKRFNEVCVGVW